MYRKRTFYMKLVNNQNDNQTSIVLRNEIKTHQPNLTQWGTHCFLLEEFFIKEVEKSFANFKQIA